MSTLNDRMDDAVYVAVQEEASKEEGLDLSETPL